MNEKEKEAVDMAKKYINILLIHDIKEDRYYDIHNLKILLNLIEKQQKEILTLKENNKTLETLLQGKLYEMYKYYRELASSYQANSVSKDKIKEKIKELENKEFLYKEEKRFNEEEIKFNYAKRILQGILGEENERRRK